MCRDPHDPTAYDHKPEGMISEFTRTAIIIMTKLWQVAHAHWQRYTNKLSKVSHYHKWSSVPSEARASVHQAGTMCQCCAISWSRARNSQEHQLCLSLQVWAPEVPTNAVGDLWGTASVLRTPQGTRFTDGWAGCTCDVFFLLLWDSNQCPLGSYPTTWTTRAPTHPHRHACAHAHTHTPDWKLSTIRYCWCPKGSW